MHEILKMASPCKGVAIESIVVSLSGLSSFCVFPNVAVHLYSK